LQRDDFDRRHKNMAPKYRSLSIGQTVASGLAPILIAEKASDLIREDAGLHVVVLHSTVFQSWLYECADSTMADLKEPKQNARCLGISLFKGYC